MNTVVGITVDVIDDDILTVVAFGVCVVPSNLVTNKSNRLPMYGVRYGMIRVLYDVFARFQFEPSVPA